MHEQQHPLAGKLFRVNIQDGTAAAATDQAIHGQTVMLIDWADRLEGSQAIDQHAFRMAVVWYSNRRLFHVNPKPFDYRTAAAADLHEALCCSKYPPAGVAYPERLYIFHEDELEELN